MPSAAYECCLDNTLGIRDNRHPMPHLATARSPDAVALVVKQHHQRFRFIAAVQDPALASGFAPVHVFGSDKNCTEALIEAMTERPGTTRYGEYEYLPNSIVSEITKGELGKDPVAAAFSRLGLVRPE
jgi:hypothetical protein